MHTANTVVLLLLLLPCLLQITILWTDVNIFINGEVYAHMNGDLTSAAGNSRCDYPTVPARVQRWNLPCARATFVDGWHALGALQIPLFGMKQMHVFGMVKIRIGGEKKYMQQHWQN